MSAFFPEDTICAPASSVGGAICTIRVSGPDSIAIIDKLVRFRRGYAALFKGYSVHLGTVMNGDEPLDDVLVTVFRAPDSYTGEDGVEISCHASQYIVNSLVHCLCESGCRMALPGEFTRRAFINGKLDLAQAEAVADVIASDSATAHKLALNQLRGGYSNELRAVRDELLQLSALVELELDFSEEDVEFADRGRLETLSGDAAAHCRALADSFRAGNAIKDGIPVAIIGAPNSGKSTLLNALLKDERAIVSDIPGTTRDTVEEIFHAGGMKFRLIDTAGLRESEDPVEALGIERSYAALQKAEIVIGLVDGTLPRPQIAEESAKLREMAPGKLMLVISKDDLSHLSTIRCSPEASDFGCIVSKSGVHPLRISARTGRGIKLLTDALVEAGKACCGDLSGLLVTNARHAEAFSAAADSLLSANASIRAGISGDLVSEDLRAAIRSLDSILGSSITPDEVLGEIFGKFCIGK